jgi:hypothetical protein
MSPARKYEIKSSMGRDIAWVERCKRALLSPYGVAPFATSREAEMERLSSMIETMHNAKAGIGGHPGISFECEAARHGSRRSKWNHEHWRRRVIHQMAKHLAREDL